MTYNEVGFIKSRTILLNESDVKKEKMQIFSQHIPSVESYNLINEIIEMPRHNYQYKLNDFGSRGPNIAGNNKDIVILGCSQTFGVGIEDYKNTWGNFLSQSMELDHINLSKAGASIFDQVVRFFSLVAKHGNPKYVFGLFPPLQRFTFGQNKHTIKLSGQGATSNYLATSNDVIDDSYVSKILKSPYPVEEVIRPETRYYYNARVILMLEQYCRSNGIEFYWSTWDHKTKSFMNDLKSFFPNYHRSYVDSDCLDQCCEVQWNIKYSDCHEEFKNIKEFVEAADKPNAHMGIHKHLHAANIFLERVNKK
jgi:hypothetical protein